METINKTNLRWSTIGPGIRFVHFIIDAFIIGLISRVINFLPFVELGGFLDVLIYPFYYILFEYYFAWTPGKLVSKTVVVTENFKKADLQTIILRTFCRFVPFEPLSCLGSNSYGWHDSWTKTYVIKRELLQEVDGEDIFNSQLSREIENSKPLKTALIAFIIILVGLAGYSGYKSLKNVFGYDIFNIESTLAKLTDKNIEQLSGEWETDWIAFKELNFIDPSTILATNNQDSIVKLNYSVDYISINIFDTMGLNFKYLLIPEEEDKIIFSDIETMQSRIVLTRKTSD